jgi:hypothetical protein
MFKLPEFDTWRDDKTCSYCGSLSEAAFFEALDAKEKLGPTDKNYKVYVSGNRKFYFQHLSSEGQDRLIQMVNDKAISFDFPGHFYVLPYFAKSK